MFSINLIPFFLLPLVYASYCGEPSICFCKENHIRCSNFETLPRFSIQRYHGTKEMDISKLRIGIIMLKNFVNLERVLLKDSGDIFCEIPEKTHIVLMNTTCINRIMYCTTMLDGYNITQMNTSSTAFVHEAILNNIKLYLGIMVIGISIIICVLLSSILIKRMRRMGRSEHIALQPLELTIFTPNSGKFW